MRPVCRFYQRGECLDSRCRYAHPLEYPVYIFSQPGMDIHPDELRAAVMRDEAMCAEADSIWLENFKTFCALEGEEPFVDITRQPDYFCPPFNTKRVTDEIERLRPTLARGWDTGRGGRPQYGQNPRGGYGGGGNRGGEYSRPRDGWGPRGRYDDGGRRDGNRQGGNWYGGGGSNSSWGSQRGGGWQNTSQGRPAPGGPRRDNPGGGGWYNQTRPANTNGPNIHDITRNPPTAREQAGPGGWTNYSFDRPRNPRNTEDGNKSPEYEYRQVPPRY